jgi:hypothetical protein
VYELPSEADAQAAAEAQRAYLASGPGRVQSPPGTDHVIQQLGSALIVYDWLPADGPTCRRGPPDGRDVVRDRVVVG